VDKLLGRKVLSSSKVQSKVLPTGSLAPTIVWNGSELTKKERSPPTSVRPKVASAENFGRIFGRIFERNRIFGKGHRNRKWKQHLFDNFFDHFLTKNGDEFSSFYLKIWVPALHTFLSRSSNCVLSERVKKWCFHYLSSKPHTFGRKLGKLPNIRPKRNIRWFLAAEYSVSAESQNTCFGRTLPTLSSEASY
jgi:hypothetical protein